VHGTTAAEPGLTLPRFIVPPAIVTGEIHDLDAATVRHLHALRLQPGDALILTDGLGTQRQGRLLSMAAGRATVAVDLEDASLRDGESPFDLTLCVALLKREKLEWVIEKGTELGVTTFVLIETERSLGKPGGTRMDRLHRVASAAVEQSQRRNLPRLDGPVTIRTALQRFVAPTLRLFCWEQADDTLHVPRLARDSVGGAVAMIGPEGGFTREEADTARQLGWRVTSLGPRVLRAETAAIAVAATMQALWGDLLAGAPRGD